MCWIRVGLEFGERGRQSKSDRGMCGICEVKNCL